MPLPERPDGQLNTIAELVSQIFVKQSEMAVTLAVMQKTLEAVPDHESRIRSLESARARMVGAGVASGVLSSGVATIIVWALSHK